MNALAAKQGYLLIDANNIGFAACATRKLTVGDLETQAIYGVLRAVRPAITMFSTLTPVVLWDGMSWRKKAFEGYKANRDKPAETKSEIVQAAVKKSYIKQKPYIQRALKHLGVPQLVAMNLEADDLAGILTDRYTAKGKKVLLASADKDWIQLVGPGVGWLDPINDVKITIKNLSEKLGYTKETKDKDGCVLTSEWRGVPSPRAWLEIKALMGDVSDNVPGVGGIGEKGAIELILEFGSVTAFINGCLDKSIDVAKLPKKFRDLAENEDKQLLFSRNMMLMDLRSPSIPKPELMDLTAGKLDHDAFATLCEELSFQSMLTDIRGWCEPFERIAA